MCLSVCQLWMERKHSVALPLPHLCCYEGSQGGTSRGDSSGKAVLCTRVLCPLAVCLSSHQVIHALLSGEGLCPVVRDGQHCICCPWSCSRARQQMETTQLPSEVERTETMITGSFLTNLALMRSKAFCGLILEIAICTLQRKYYTSYK